MPTVKRCRCGSENTAGGGNNMKAGNQTARLARRDLLPFVPYRNGGDRDREEIRMNSNEAPYCPVRRGRVNRYPDPRHEKLRKKLSDIYQVPRESLFTGNGSDEIIDLLIRGFCEPGKDHIVVPVPAYGMYRIYAALNGVDVIFVPLNHRFQPDKERILKEGKGAKILFLCSPNNPTGNLLSGAILKDLIRNFPGLVVVDEAYIDFSPDPGWIGAVPEYPNLLVLRTLSKGWGLAGVRIGFLRGDPWVVSYLSAIKPPYNISRPSLDIALKGLERARRVSRNMRATASRRDHLRHRLKDLKFVRHVYSSEANFLLVKFRNGQGVFRYLLGEGIRVRDVSDLPGCGDCLRITVGNHREIRKLMKILTQYREEE